MEPLLQMMLAGLCSGGQVQLGVRSRGDN
jgi:hypothetical protein